MIHIFPSSIALSGALAFCATLAPFSAHACSQWELARETAVGQAKWVRYAVQTLSKTSRPVN